MWKMKRKTWDAQKMLSDRGDLNLEFPAGLEDLTLEETKSIIGGENIAFWLGRAAGQIAKLFS